MLSVLVVCCVLWHLKCDLLAHFFFVKAGPSSSMSSSMSHSLCSSIRNECSLTSSLTGSITNSLSRKMLSRKPVSCRSTSEMGFIRMDLPPTLRGLGNFCMRNEYTCLCACSCVHVRHVQREVSCCLSVQYGCAGLVGAEWTQSLVTAACCPLLSYFFTVCCANYGKEFY